RPSWISLSPDGRLLATLSYAKDDKRYEDHIRVWDLTTGKTSEVAPAAKKLPPRYLYYSMAPAFTPDGKALAISSSDEFVRLWDPVTGKELKSSALGTSGHSSTLAFSQDGKTLAAAIGGKSIRLIDVASGRESRPRVGHHYRVNHLALTPDGRTAIT